MDHSAVANLSSRIKQVAGQQMNEAMTKHSLVLPFIQSLGYDIFNPAEVAAEFTADVGTKKHEKIDFAILREGQPVMMIECKMCGAALDAGKCNQLHRYFMTHPTAKIGILTNGVKYLFFTDLEQPNIMDAKPFMEVDFSAFNERFLPELQKLTKDKWDIDGALSSASSLKYVREVKKVFAEEVANPSDGFVKYFASRAYDGSITAKVRELFSTIVRRAINEYINDQINSRLDFAKVDEAASHDVSPQAEDVEEDKAEVITTEEERTAYLTIKAILHKHVNPARVVMRDAKSYCAILLDDNNRKPICRLYFNGKKKFVGFFLADKTEEKIQIAGLDDLFLHEERLKAAVEGYSA
ncbi:type I restriction endonuclease [Megalodesulfovibrio gigas]|uniref:Type I restriction enzyme R protein N-terminal domain-containing protein n=1 Tax=Megalodesulfovibrio gigas (strain ATCC 19364 / DSM 1382 / NCIMB 9332 / VKM B-1759) TaxID=1121448 RepID=T2G9G5_MEGG1|nr:type I restriction endonuclease [Megalodesulfovibrio gigas]AGW12819.1 hypothetical protein DGI_0932 [Megalodesulfovibrio gigas DSM 1382 = ATCC 19364]